MDFEYKIILKQKIKLNRTKRKVIFLNVNGQKRQKRQKKGKKRKKVIY